MIQGNSHTLRWSNGYVMVFIEDGKHLKFFFLNKENKNVSVENAGMEESHVYDLVKYFQSWLGVQSDKKSGI